MQPHIVVAALVRRELRLNLFPAFIFSSVRVVNLCCHGACVRRIADIRLQTLRLVVDAEKHDIKTDYIFSSGFEPELGRHCPRVACFLVVYQQISVYVAAFSYDLVVVYHDDARVPGNVIGGSRRPAVRQRMCSVRAVDVLKVLVQEHACAQACSFQRRPDCRHSFWQPQCRELLRVGLPPSWQQKQEQQCNCHSPTWETFFIHRLKIKL